MKKIVKALTIMIVAVTAVFACVFALAACTEKSSDYNFTVVYGDNTPVKGNNGGNATDFDGNAVTTVCIQLCKGTDCKEYTLINHKTINSKGKISFSQQEINEVFNSTTDVTEFSFHIWNVSGDNNNYIVEVTAKGDYTLELTTANIYQV